MQLTTLDMREFVKSKLEVKTPVKYIYEELQQHFNNECWGAIRLNMIATSGYDNRVDAIIRVAAKRELRARQ